MLKRALWFLTSWCEVNDRDKGKIKGIGKCGGTGIGYHESRCVLSYKPTHRRTYKYTKTTDKISI